MEKFRLQLEKREGKKKPNQLRRDGKIPATLYGPGIPSESVQVNEREFSRLPAAAHSHILELQDGNGTVNAIIRHIQRKATTHEVLNIEFYRVQADRKLTVTVPLKFTGSSPAVHAGGQLVESYQEAEVECLPSAIPDFITVDISQITEIESGIHFSELTLPEGVKVLNPPDEIVVRVVASRATAETPAAAGA